ncbi:hypothetical protein EIP91_000567 [Steccherinum ochraceum]|uniref:RRM domain-containing protein n=1 Tax=Steccherinum ochraceum TaxID=92696 RepID=A0A4R0RW82_9APHY|nr:hypothetical protein EIP91_000567 [Steccherinum ochraceum]
MSDAAKLTKKQKKALAFRERKGKGRAKPGDDFNDEDNAVPLAEDQDRAEVLPVEGREVDKPDEGGDKAVVRTQGVKRKRKADEEGEGERGGKEDEHDVESQPKKQKKRKARSSDAVPGGDEAEDEDAGSDEKAKKGSKENPKQQRFILFVGNLKYTTTADAVREHFKACEPPPSVRLRTPKPSETSKPTAKSKGFAFLEFVNKAALQQALKLHHSQLEGRDINVELTAGGGGKGEGRLAKLKTRNKELHDQRVKRIQKQSPKGRGPNPKEDAESELRPQRYSSTSGVEQVQTTQRTWTVGNTPEENVRQKKRGKKPPKSQGTGVNAIPVG